MAGQKTISTTYKPPPPVPPPPPTTTWYSPSFTSHQILSGSWTDTANVYDLDYDTHADVGGQNVGIELICPNTGGLHVNKLRIKAGEFICPSGKVKVTIDYWPVGEDHSTNLVTNYVLDRDVPAIIDMPLIDCHMIDITFTENTLTTHELHEVQLGLYA